MILADADSGRIGLIVALVLAIPFIIDSRKILGRFLILASTWVGAYTLHTLFYQALILKERTVGSLFPYALAVIGLLAAGILLTKWGQEKDSGAQIKWKLGVILIAACLIAGIVGVEVLGRQDPETENTNFIYELREVLHGNIQDEFGTYRAYIWRNAFEVFPEYPIIGSGPDTFFYAFPEDAHRIVDEDYENAHNEYIQRLICQGILGLILYLVFLGGILLKSIPKAFKNPLVMAALAAFVAYLAQAFFNISVVIASQMMWVLAGMLASKRVREATLREMG